MWNRSTWYLLSSVKTSNLWGHSTLLYANIDQEFPRGIELCKDSLKQWEKQTRLFKKITKRETATAGLSQHVFVCMLVHVHLPGCLWSIFFKVVWLLVSDWLATVHDDVYHSFKTCSPACLFEIYREKLLELVWYKWQKFKLSQQNWKALQTAQTMFCELKCSVNMSLPRVIIEIYS